MRTRHDLTADQQKTYELGPDLMRQRQRPVSLRGKVFSGLLAGAIVITVSSAFDRSYDIAEASGAAQVRIAEAEAQASPAASPRELRGVTGMASAKHDWVFDR